MAFLVFVLFVAVIVATGGSFCHVAWGISIRYVYSKYYVYIDRIYSYI